MLIDDRRPTLNAAEDRLSTLAELVGVALSTADAGRRQRALVDEQGALNRVAQLLANRASLEAVFVAVTQEASVLLGGLSVALMRS